jgi:hypothetical protein
LAPLPSRAGMTEIRATRRRQARDLRYLNVAGGRPPGFPVSATGELQLQPLYGTHMGAFATGRCSRSPKSQIAENARHADWQRPAKDLTGVDRDQP